MAKIIQLRSATVRIHQGGQAGNSNAGQISSEAADLPGSVSAEYVVDL